MAGDSPDLGAKIITITDNNKRNGDKLSRQLGMELFSFRKDLAPKTYSANDAVIELKDYTKKIKTYFNCWYMG